VAGKPPFGLNDVLSVRNYGCSRDEAAQIALANAEMLYADLLPATRPRKRA
jgi:hypothetical protein